MELAALCLATVTIIVGTGTDIVTTVADATAQLQQRYISSRYSSSIDEWPPYQPTHYTTLAFIHNKGRCTDAVRFSVAQELAVAGKINLPQVHKYSDTNASMTKNISDIFVALDGYFVDLHILIEGAPGIGKTVLAKEIAYQWAKKELLTSRKLLLLVFLRECHQLALTSIESLVQHIFKTNKITKHFTKYLLETEGEDAIIVFDGFDELSEDNRKASIIIDIINRRILTKCCLVVTSRLTASSNLHGSVDRRVEIVGFTEEDRLDYIQSALESDEQVKDLQHYLQCNPTINALCYIPLNMTILLCLFRDGIDRLPKTQTEMYKKFIEMTIVRFIKKQHYCDTIISIPNLSHPYKNLFLELANLAYKALKVDKIVFTLPEIEEGCPNLTMTSSNWNGLGLLKGVKCFSEELCSEQVTFHFLHFSLQEYMAAWHVSMLPEKKQIELLQETFWEHRYYNLWIMYVGITCGSTFALRHFLSGNHFQLFTKLFKTSKVSNRYLKHKTKCLHLFQCLVEANKEDIIDSVKKLFQNNQIDLSNQTLLPSDLNTVGFFLIRSINNKWDKLNLFNCNIGSNGCKILCDTFLDKDIRYMVTIKRVNFSYNQLNFSSLCQLFGLFTSWHTSEIIITDDAIIDNANDMKTLEDIVLQSNTLLLALIGSFLFSKSIPPNRMLTVLSNTTSIRSVYLLNCSWESSDAILLSLLKKQKIYKKIRIIASSLDKSFIKTMALLSLNNNNSVNMFVYNPTMSDETANDISGLILSLHKDISGVMLILSKSKIQGIVNTCMLSDELSDLELYNLSIYIRGLNTKMCPWKGNLECSNSSKETTIYSFIELLYKIDFNWKLKIILQENDIVIIHKVEFKSSIKLIKFTNISVVYLSSCDFTYYYEISSIVSSTSLNNNIKAVMSNPVSELYIINCELISKEVVSCVLKKLCVINGTVFETTLIEILKRLLDKRFEVSISNIKIIDNDWMIRNLIARKEFYCNIKINLLLSTEHWLFVYNITKYQSKLVNQYFMNQVLLDCHGTTVSTKLDQISGDKMYIFENNLLKVVRLCAEVPHVTDATQIIVALSNTTSVNTIEIDNYIITNKMADNLANILQHETQLQELYLIRNCLLANNAIIIATALHSVKTLTVLCISDNNITDKATDDIATTVSHNINLQELNLGNNNLQASGAIKIARSLQKISSLTKLYINHNGITKEATDDIAAAISCNTKLQELDVSENSIQTVGIVKIMKALKGIHTLRMLCFSNNNISCEAANHIAVAISHNIKLQELNVGDNCLQSLGVIQITKSLQNLSTLTKLCMCNCLITDEAADGIAATICSNVHIQEFNISNNLITESGAMKIAKALQKVSTLTKLCINHNSINYKATDDIAAIISHNIHLQELNLGSNNLQASGAIKIAKSLQKISSLTKLYINHNGITKEATDDIAAAISCNTKLQEFDVSENNIQTAGAVNIMNALKGIHVLRMLCFSNNYIIYEAADHIAAVISHNIELQELNLGDNFFQSLGIIKITKSLQNLSTLTKLCMSNCLITDEAADSIAATICSNIHLQEFNISNNLLTESGAIKIAKPLQKVSILTKLCINHNSINYKATDDIAAIISHNIHLQELNLGSNNLQASGAIKIARSLQKISSLTKLYINHNSITEEATDDIAAAISCNTKLQEFDVSGNNIQTVGATKVIKALKDIHTLRILCFSNNNISYEAVDDFAIAISHNIELQKLNIDNNFLQSLGVIKITKSLQNLSTLTKLCVCNCLITDEAADDIAATICSNIHLQEFNISNNLLTESGAIKIAKALQKVSTLTKLYINHNSINYKATDDIAAIISHNIHLQELNLGSNNLQASGAIKIARSLQKISSLTKLYINHNGITKEATDDIAAAISCNTKLQEFDVSGNNIQTAGAVNIIMKALKDIHVLRMLCFGNNNITYDAADYIAVAISHNIELQELNLDDNFLQSLGVTIITKSLQNLSTLTKLCMSNCLITDEAADGIAATICSNIHLQEFNVSNNLLTKSGAIKIAKALQEISTLRKLCIDHNDINDDAALDIGEAIRCNIALNEVCISGNEFSRTIVMVISYYTNNLTVRNQIRK